MSYHEWLFLYSEPWQAVTFGLDSSEAWKKMKEVELPWTFPLDSSEAWQALKEVELPLYGCRWTDSVLLQIAKVQSNPERWSCGEQLTNDAITRDQLMLRFILETRLIPFTTEQVIKWLDWYGYRIKNNEVLEIWYYPKNEPILSFHVDTMIKGTNGLVDFLFTDSHLFSANVCTADGTMKELMFTFVSKNKEDKIKRKFIRPRKVRKKEGIDPDLTTESQNLPTTPTEEEPNEAGYEDGKRSIDCAERELATGTGSRSTTRRQNEEGDDGPEDVKRNTDSAELLRHHLIFFDGED